MTRSRRRLPRWLLCGALALIGASAAADEGLVRPLDSGLHEFVGVAKCKTCHKKELIGNQYGAWLVGPHKQAYETLANDQSLAIAQRMNLSGAPNENAACLRCHVSAFGLPAMRIANPVLHEDGVGCESCHGPGRDYRKKKIMSDREQAESKGLWDVSHQVGVCESCHNPESPTYDPTRYVRADGSTVGFDFEIAKARVLHPIPEDVKGRYLELEKAQKEAEKAAAR